MRNVLFAAFVYVSTVIVAHGQTFTSVTETVTVYSENENYYLISVPYDDELSTTRGKTLVYKRGNPDPLYTLERGFDSVGKTSNNLILSNDGEIIFFALPYANESKEELKSITIYSRGRLVRSFAEREITGCDDQTERCDVIYSNFSKVVDFEKSGFGTPSFRKVLREGTDDQERFLSDFPIFSRDDTVYLTDRKKHLHRFDLRDVRYLGWIPFESAYLDLRASGRTVHTELKAFDHPVFLDFPKLKNGKDSAKQLAQQLDMKVFDALDPKEDQYRSYSFNVTGNLYRDGHFEVENVEFSDELPRDKIIEFFKVNTFDSRSVPQIAEMWNVHEEYFFFRNKSDRVARAEKRQELDEINRELERRKTLEVINGVYIPKNLEEAFLELDRFVKEVDKKEMMALKAGSDMIVYHLGLGTWMRNNWGLWGRSRLREYFATRKITHPEEISSIILERYYDWLTGNKEVAKEWELQHPPQETK